MVPVSVRNEETAGIALLTQYNPHGIFIALEEAGYLLMSISFLCVAVVFPAQTRRLTAIRWLFVLGFVVPLAALVLVGLAATLWPRRRRVLDELPELCERMESGDKLDDAQWQQVLDVARDALAELPGPNASATRR